MAKRRRRIITVNDRMQKGYRYVLSAAPGRNFDPAFKPQLTPAEMLDFLKKDIALNAEVIKAANIKLE